MIIKRKKNVNRGEEESFPKKKRKNFVKEGIKDGTFNLTLNNKNNNNNNKILDFSPPHI